MLVRARSATITLFPSTIRAGSDYLRLPHSLSLAMLDEVSAHYWEGDLVEESVVHFRDERWWEPPVIEALFQGELEPVFA